MVWRSSRFFTIIASKFVSIMAQVFSLFFFFQFNDYLLYVENLSLGIIAQYWLLEEFTFHISFFFFKLCLHMSGWNQAIVYWCNLRGTKKFLWLQIFQQPVTGPEFHTDQSLHIKGVCKNATISGGLHLLRTWFLNSGTKALRHEAHCLYL